MAPMLSGPDRVTARPGLRRWRPSRRPGGQATRLSHPGWTPSQASGLLDPLHGHRHLRWCGLHVYRRPTYRPCAFGGPATWSRSVGLTSRTKDRHRPSVERGLPPAVAAVEDAAEEGVHRAALRASEAAATAMSRVMAQASTSSQLLGGTQPDVRRSIRRVTMTANRRSACACSTVIAPPPAPSPARQRGTRTRTAACSCGVGDPDDRSPHQRIRAAGLSGGRICGSVDVRSCLSLQRPLGLDLNRHRPTPCFLACRHAANEDDGAADCVCSRRIGVGSTGGSPPNASTNSRG